MDDKNKRLSGSGLDEDMANELEVLRIIEKYRLSLIHI